MIIIYGTRFYGRVRSHGDQFQHTRFFHIYYVPLIPVGTMWVTGEYEDGYRGHSTKLSGRSIFAGYARVWGPLLAIACSAAGGIGGIAAATVLATLTMWSWNWRTIRDPREQRRSDFHLLACGTRCDPLHMPHELATTVQSHVADCWSAASNGRTPEDVARLGAADPGQAVFAYASLRVAARLAPGEHARASRDLAERVLDSVKDIDPSALEGGPYRAPADAA